MQLAQVVTTPGGEESLLLLDGEYTDNASLIGAMKRHPSHFVPDAEYRLVPYSRGYRYNSKNGNVEEVR